MPATRRTPMRSFRHEGALYVSPPTKIGKHRWRIVVYKHESYGPCTEYQWQRLHADNASAWYGDESWPTYNGDDTYGGLPKSLRWLYESELTMLRRHGIGLAH